MEMIKSYSKSAILRRTSSVVSAVFVVVFLGTRPAGAADGPKLVVDEPVYNIGDIYQGESAEHVFVVRNDGSEPLKIESVRSSCGCTAAMMDKNELAPGETAELKAVFNSSRFKGAVSKKIFINSNDPDYPITTLELKSIVDIDIDVNPARIYFHGLKTGEQLDREITISNLSDSEISILEISSTVPDIKTELTNMTIAPGGSTKLNLHIDKINKEMRLTGELTIRNSSPQSVVKVLLYGGQIN